MDLKRMFGKTRKRPSFMTAMICIDCHHMWKASNISHPCPVCASREVIAASRWQPDNSMFSTDASGRAGSNE